VCPLGRWVVTEDNRRIGLAVFAISPLLANREKSVQDNKIDVLQPLPFTKAPVLITALQQLSPVEFDGSV
jgi:hypothetical protein